MALPRSKKTRALLAYLITTERSQSRDRLCSMLWDTTDDPRGALRWSLSKLRSVVDDDAERIVADRLHVAFDPAGAWVDVTELTATVSAGAAGSPTEALEHLAARTRGEFLEGLELPDAFEFQAWCIAGRERTREARCQMLSELVHRLAGEPRRALPFARARARVDGFDPASRLELLELLLRAGKREEAFQQYELSRRLFREVGAAGIEELDEGWRSLRSSAAPETEAPPLPRREAVSEVRRARPEPSARAFVGREREKERLAGWMARARTDRTLRIVLVNGEPGAGKSRLADAVADRAREDGLEVLAGRAYEAESSRPYGPWVDALGAEIAWPGAGEREAPEPSSREGLFAAVAGALATRAQRAGGALLVLDDVQWLDRDSSELLHFVARSAQDLPLLVTLLARSGELADNEPMLRAIRGIRREVGLQTLHLEPLAPEETAELVAGFEGADAPTIHHASAGNPLYALELARAASAASDDDEETETTPSSLLETIQERVDRLPPQAAEVLRWASVLGHFVGAPRLRALSSLAPEELVEALEQLEGRALLRSGGAPEADGPDHYLFAHDVVREAVYASLSQPRRRLMHAQVAKLLEEDVAEPSVATELAHHARLAGEASLGVRACLVAGMRSLRVFANGDAEALALRGLDLVDELPEAERIAAALELLHLQYSARTPDREEAASRVQELAMRALDLGLTTPARLGFQMLSFLRWESSSMADAHDNILQAERVSRSAAAGERAVALAQAARCLVLLERNLAQAEAFVLEADALGKRSGSTTSAVQFAIAMIHEHRGELDEARQAFREARWLGREQGDRLAEFRALEHWTMLEIDRGRLEEARVLAKHLADLGGRVREGAEGPSGRALLALAERLSGEETATARLDEAMDDLARADAKYPLTFVSTRLARWELERGDGDAARGHAETGLELATAIGRVSDVALSRHLLARCAAAAGDPEAEAEQRAALDDLARGELSVAVRALLEAPPETSAAG